MGRAILEICVETLADARAARDGGADRVELCAALATGGVTPSLALVEAVAAVGLPVHVMVRPADGGFVHDADTIAMIARDMALLAERGVAGLVVGALTADGVLDREAMARWRDAVPDTALVLHRAVDLARSPVEAVDQAAALGVDHVLTSGGAATAADGSATIAAMVAAAAGRLSVVAGSGITPANAAAVLAATGAGGLHASASDTGDWADPRIGAFGFGGTRRRWTSVERVASIGAAIRHGTRTNEIH